MNNRDDVNAERRTILEYDGIITWREHDQLVTRLDSRAHRKGISPSNVFMLTSLLKDESGHGMYAKRSRKTYSYSCRKACGFGARVEEADAEVTNDVLEDYGELPHMVRRVVPGENYFDQIARLRQEIRELDPEGDDEKREELRAEIQRLRALPSKSDEVKWVSSGRTIAQHWESLDNAGRRDWLRENGWSITAIKDDDMPNGWRLMIDTGRTAEISVERQAKSLGFPVDD